jgi:hypothetical protein
MRLLDFLFDKKLPSAREAQNTPLIYGGDGMSEKTAAVVNCGSMGYAKLLIDQFISEQLGQKDTDWKHLAAAFVKPPGLPEFTVRAIGVTPLCQCK